MKIDILFRLSCLFLVIGSIKANESDDAAGKEDAITTTIVPLVVNKSKDLNGTSTNDTVTDENGGSSNETSTSTTTIIPEVTTNSTVSSIPSTTDSAETTTNATAANVTTRAPSTESVETTPTTDLSTGENNPTAAPAKPKSGGFNALSFIGGIVFTVGLLAIMYVGFKFYKSRTERNYHTL